MDLDIKRVLASKPEPPNGAPLIPLTTPWGDELDEEHVREECPRPQFARENWTCLNGWWEYAIVESSAARDLFAHAQPPKVWDGQILVPFSPEASLSGVGRQLGPKQLLWYRRSLDVGKPDESMRAILHFGAVDYACACWVNGTQVGTHMGGYLHFDFDVTDALQAEGNVVELCVWDPSDTGTQLRGKQRLLRGNMWYTGQSGIWKTVWLEQVPERHIVGMTCRADADAGDVTLIVLPSMAGGSISLEVIDRDGGVVASATSETDEIPDEGIALTAHLDEPHLWSPGDPYLYDLRVVCGEDVVSSYCAFRTVGIERDAEGVPRFCLNHKPFFVRGLLDQGYWPDGLMTAPSDEAMIADIQTAREAGFNMLRKHIKVEDDRWYWHCDRLGMLVWQDMVSGGAEPEEWMCVNIPTLFRRGWTSFGDVTPGQRRRLGASDEAYRAEWRATAVQTMLQLSCHPCVATWVVFNESWGQFSSAAMTELLRSIDDSRPFVATSGWYDQGAGDYFAVHNYFRSMRVYRDPFARRRNDGPRAFLINEFGGLTCSVDGHVSIDTTYGYDSFSSIETWRASFWALLDEVDALQADGLAGFVYTQLSDVEEETNGIVTYDRRVNKLHEG